MYLKNLKVPLLLVAGEMISCLHYIYLNKFSIALYNHKLCIEIDAFST